MKIKRVLSFILIISMLMTSMLVIHAEETETYAEQAAKIITDVDTYERATEVLSMLGIMKGRANGDFGMTDALTRAEMCAIAIRFIGLDSEKNAVFSDSLFSDVAPEHWAKYYIDMATSHGFVQGNGDNTFAPDSSVTIEQAAKIIVCALGYEPKAQSIGEYPESYLSVAMELGLFKGIKLAGQTDMPIARGQVAMLVYNALEADMMEVVEFGDAQNSSVVEDMSVLKVYHKIERKRGTVTATYETAFDNEDRSITDVEVDNIKYVTDLNLGKYLGQYIEFYYTIPTDGELGKILMVFPAEQIKSTKIDFDDVENLSVSESFDIKVEYYTNGGNKLNKLNIRTPIIMYNGKKESFSTAAEAQAFLDLHMIQGQLVMQENKGQNLLFVENYDAYVVSSVDADDKRLSVDVYEVGKVGTATLNLSPNPSVDSKIFVYDENGDEIDLSQIVTNDVIMVYASSDNTLYNIYRSKKQVTGTVEGVEVVDNTGGSPVWVPRPEVEPYWETVNEINMDGFTQTAGSTTDSTWGRTYGKTVDGKTHYVQMTSEGGNSGKWFIGKNSKIVDITNSSIANEFATNRPAIIENNMVAMLDRTYNNSAGTGWPSSEARYIVGDLFTSADVSVGDTVKVTAWVLGRQMYNVNTTAAGDPHNFSTRMWTGADSSTLQIFEMESNQWQEMSITFTVNEAILTNSNLKIDNYITSGVYPTTLFLAGIKVEKYFEPTTTSNPNLEPRPDIPLDMTKYEVVVNGEQYKSSNSFPSSLLELGKTMTLMLDLNDKIVGYSSPFDKEGYGLLMNVGVKTNSFEDGLYVQILKPDGRLANLETTEEVKAYDGTDVRKIPAVSLVTDQPSNPMTDWHLWSTNNAENFEAVDRTWLSDRQRSIAASRKIIYYELNSEGKIRTILVPSIPEDHPEAKIKMIRNFGAKEGQKKPIFQQFWPQWLMNASVYDFTEHLYRYTSKTVWYEVWSQDYDETEYKVGDGGSYWNDNRTNGKTWNHAQLYRIPGSETIEFIVTNPHKLYDGKTARRPFVVERVSETADGYVLYGYHTGASMNMTRPLSSYKVKEDLRVMENIWVSSLEADSERLTWDNIGYYEGRTPYNVSYESAVMGNQETPYFNASSVQKGDAVLIIVENNEVTYLEPILRRSVGLPSSYGTNNAASPAAAYEKEGALVYGEITAIDSVDGVLTIEGWNWGKPDEPISSASVGYVSATASISSFKAQWYPFMANALWDEESEKFRTATWGDYEVGDKVLIIGTLDVDTYSYAAILYKTKK